MDSQVPTQQPPASTEMRLIDVPINDENVALNVLVSFLNVAQKRGAFSIAESAKIYECIQKFIQQTLPPVPEEDEIPESSETANESS